MSSANNSIHCCEGRDWREIQISAQERWVTLKMSLGSTLERKPSSGWRTFCRRTTPRRASRRHSDQIKCPSRSLISTLAQDSRWVRVRGLCPPSPISSPFTFATRFELKACKFQILLSKWCEFWKQVVDESWMTKVSIPEFYFIFLDDSRLKWGKDWKLTRQDPTQRSQWQRNGTNGMPYAIYYYYLFLQIVCPWNLIQLLSQRLKWTGEKFIFTLMPYHSWRYELLRS